ncbi:MAG: universal stress protein [Methanomicrobiales archaeon]|nr:universal stress protein [Methanomicrobiales archaeon]MDI6875741.1 universal stress protein [Methanomicrobiales archaeon]
MVVPRIIEVFGFASIMEGSRRSGLDPKTFKEDALEPMARVERKRAGEVQGRIQREGPKAEVRIEFGKSRGIIARVAEEEEDAGIIVIGAQGKGGRFGQPSSGASPKEPSAVRRCLHSWCDEPPVRNRGVVQGWFTSVDGTCRGVPR